MHRFLEFPSGAVRIAVVQREARSFLLSVHNGSHPNMSLMLRGPVSPQKGLLMGSIYFQQPPMVPVYQVVLLRNRAQSFSIACSIPHKHFGGTFQISADEEPFECSVPCTSLEASQVLIGSFVKSETDEKHQLLNFDECLRYESHNASRPAKKRIINPEVEIQRRKKIGLANKGNIPWNKGRQHSQETRDRIKRRTIEALRDPKVRKKMSESPHSHSEQSKAKISFSLRKIWEERLKHKKLQAECYLIWAGVVAEAARKGGHDQQELEWDSFEKMKSDILIQHLQWKTERAREKEIAKRRAERAAKAKADKMPRHVEERKEDKMVKAKKSKKPLKQPVKKNLLATSMELKLRDRLTKIHQKPQCEGHELKSKVAVQFQPTAEKGDLEFIKKEKMRQTVSFADQILAIKKERVVHTAKNVLIPHSPVSLLE